ncbi:MAG: hemolysin family protein [Thermoleophilia bacterium]
MSSLLPELLSALFVLAVVAVLIALNGLFVAAEFALVGAPRAAIERLAADGRRAAVLVRRILHDPRSQDRYIATAQVGITAASLGLGMYGEHRLAEWFAAGLDSLGAGRWIAAHSLASVLAVSVLTYFHIVLGEMVPKSLALQSAEKTALWISPPMRWIQYLLYPVVLALNAVGNVILRLGGIRREATETEYHTPEEIEYLVEESEERGLLPPQAGQVLRDIFDFGARAADEVMVPRVRISGIPLGAGPDELGKIIREFRHTRYPVFDGDLDHIVGTVHIKDVLGLLRQDRNLERADVRAVPFVPETAQLDTLLAVMERAHNQMVIIMDEHGGTAGLVTLEDLFEELVGEIEEERLRDPDFLAEPDGSFLVKGTVRLDEVGEILGRELEHEEVDTVSGLVLSLLDRPPVAGDVVVYGGLIFEVVNVEGLGVSSCRIREEER